MIETKANILLIEDDLSMRETVKAILEDDGYAVKGVETGLEAIELANQMSFDIALIDYNLPDMNGLEIMKQISVISKTHVPVMVSASRSLEIAVEGMRLGAHDYLVKPVDPEELKRTLQKIMLEREKINQGKSKFMALVRQINTMPKKQFEKVIDNDLEAEEMPGSRKINISAIMNKIIRLKDSLKH